MRESARIGVKMVLDKIAESTRRRVEIEKSRLPFDLVKQAAIAIKNGEEYDAGLNELLPVSPSGREDFAFEKALRESEISFICEVKKASPSKGVIALEFPYLEIAREYVEAGAAAISVLTEPEYFMGSDRYLSQISQSVPIPVIRKDFTIDAYQIYQAKIIGADAVLLICALLDIGTLKNYLSICDELGLSALVEAHSEREIESAVQTGARIIGVNNRDLKTFEVDIHNCTRLREKVPADLCFVAESGIKTDSDIAILRAARVNAVLVGEALMKSPDKSAMLSYLRGQGA